MENNPKTNLLKASLEYFGSEEAFKQWMVAPNHDFPNDASPVSMLSSGHEDLVVARLENLLHGIPS